MVFLERHHEIVGLPPQKEYHSMENQIWHPAEHIRRAAQVVRRVGTGYTAGTPSLTRYSGITEVYRAVIQLRMVSLDAELKSAPSTTH